MGHFLAEYIFYKTLLLIQFSAINSFLTLWTCTGHWQLGYYDIVDAIFS